MSISSPFILSCSRVAAAFCALVISMNAAVNAVSKLVHSTGLSWPIGLFVRVTFSHSALT